MQPASEDEIRRAMKALADAPRTETGLIVPPHVAAQQHADRALEDAPLPNRQQRRWQEKMARREAKRSKR